MLTTTCVLVVAAMVLLSPQNDVAGDVYMHNPRGSNNRNGQKAAQTTNNRLFNSQNNDNGGYGKGKQMAYYEGSFLTVEWTQQHACGNDNTHCDLILQYMCGYQDDLPQRRIRDGTASTIIPESGDEAHAKTGGGIEYTFGMHETQEYYAECKTRERNKGLFIADRTLQRQSAAYTRQNNNVNGNRRGYECQEERDYYPYWHPSPWKDIAVLTTDTSRCGYYRSESQNGRDKGHCVNDESEAKMKEAWAHNHEEKCVAEGHEWRVDSKHNIAKPECLHAPWSRDNHLGNSITDTLAGYASHYNWTLPTSGTEDCIKDDNCVCVLRLRYNITTADYEGRPQKKDFVDASRNGDKEGEAVITQDPYHTIAGEMLSLALNTNQYGRTFQDRSHTFTIRPRPKGVNFGQRIFNLNVRGRRGNIVQCYPAVEYDFVPTHLVVRWLDYVHPQWTGFDNNHDNGNNRGEGTDDTDRHNMVQIESMNHNRPTLDKDEDFKNRGVTPLFGEVQDRLRFALLGQGNCRSLSDLQANNNNNNGVEQDAQNCMKLNAASPYFDGGLIRLNKTGSFFYMSTRNNNFSNRSQKGSITVMPILRTWAIVFAAVGSALLISTFVVGGLAMYAKANPLSKAAEIMQRF